MRIRVVQDHAFNFKWLQYGGRVSLVGDASTCPMVWVNIIRFKHKNELVREDHGLG